MNFLKPSRLRTKRRTLPYRRSALTAGKGASSWFTAGKTKISARMNASKKSSSGKRGRGSRKPCQSVGINPETGKPFLDPRSHVRRNGCIWLYGADMKELRARVFFRCNGYCEAKSHASACPIWVDWENGEMDHIRPKKMGGSFRNDSEKNCQWLSGPCHQEKTRPGIVIEREVEVPEIELPWEMTA